MIVAREQQRQQRGLAGWRHSSRPEGVEVGHPLPEFEGQEGRGVPGGAPHYRGQYGSPAMLARALVGVAAVVARVGVRWYGRVGGVLA